MQRQAALAIALLAFFAFSGCVSQPKKKPEPTPTPTQSPTPTPSETPSATPSAGAPEAAQAEALSLRKKCVDYGLNDSMRDDFQAADAFYAKGAESYGVDNLLSASSYTEAIARFRLILGAGLSGIADQEKGKADSMKQAALKLGADRDSPDQLALGDSAYSGADAKAAAKDPEGAIAGYRSALLSYEIGYDRSKALGVRDQIDGKKWSEYDPGNYQLAGQKLAESDKQFAADQRSSLDAIQESLLRYNLVLKKGWEYALGQSRGQSEDEKKKADGIKSDKAAPGEYAQAQAAYDDAMSLEAQERYEEANGSYAAAADMFAKVYATAKGKMDRATTALDALRARREQSKRTAEQGDSALGSGAKEGAK